MRTDHKIGIAALLFVVVLIVSHRLFATRSAVDGSQEQTSAEAQTTPPQPATIPAAAVVDNDRVIVGLGEGFTGPPARSAAPRAREARAVPALMRVGDNYQTARVTLAGELINRPPRSRMAALAGRTRAVRTYVVREGDQGFWTVSKNVYGHGKYWALIQDANPGDNSRALRPGRKLKIPPLPALQTSARGPAAAVAVNRSRGADGKSYYYHVEAGDNGFWRVAEKVYGDGKHWTLIKRANPQVNSWRLQVGQRLLIVPLPKRSAARRPPAAPRRALRAGEQWYIVKAGDAGLWDVAAKSQLRNGKYWRLVRKANSQLTDDLPLHAGQKLIIPPVPARHTAAAKPPTRRYYDAEPNFE